ncbi:MAG: aspartate aminotransferase family protein [Bacteroidetes bacterium]|nr:aspartate aminotransferase family protein [Bacteroidota bacterium]
MPEKNLQRQMQQEMIDKKIFNQAKEYAFDYADKALERNVYPTDAAIENLHIFDEQLPDSTSDSLGIIELLHRYGSPATVTQIGGRYFGLVNGGAIPTALAAKWLNDFWDQNTPLFVTSPITSKLEAVVESWLKQLFRLPESTVAGFVSGTSMSILCGLAAARFRIYQRLNWDFNSKGFINAPKVRIVTGKHTHATVLKTIALLGFGTDTIEWVAVDSQGRMIVNKIPELDENTILVLQAGNVNSGSFDYFDEISNKAQKTNTWVHIDGAFGLWAAGSEHLKYLTSGIEKADSWSVDGHKTLNTPYDCGIVLCSDKEALVSALQATGSYIVYGENRDGMLYTPEMSRRARAIELWAAMKYLGKQGINELVYGLHERAKQFAEGLSEHGFKILNEVVFNQVLVACDSDSETEETLKNLQELRECWCGGSVWFDKKVIRISVCSWATTEEDVIRSVLSFVKARNQVEMK